MDSIDPVNESIDCMGNRRSCYSGIKWDNKVAKVVIFDKLVVVIDGIICGIYLTEIVRLFVR